MHFKDSKLSNIE